ncbi:glycosyltransferase family 4 protein [Qipengyuania sphaerica]|uniref:glycosyltransferase family 4 protein n=1 Tax=Qipengyuania sphaerica TaxID=2867243 RepID=UPI001C87E64E|nr:glycosyltransferase family 4 protein [Qipengyuania sphaerica]MBX7539464.1 glycosyltransferase family 4 protein [Qipengyuania sphaerica]
MQVGVFHPGTQHSRQTALALQDLGRLAFLATGLFDHPDSAARKLAGMLPDFLSSKIEREMGRFAFPRLDPAKVRGFPRYELPERIATRLGARGLAGRLDQSLNAAFGERIAAIAKDEGPLALWGYDGSSFSAFRHPRTKDCPKILDRTMADCRSWNAERERQLALQGEWFTGGSPAWSARRIEQDDEEYAAADRIVCGSPFVMETILEYSQVPGLADKLELLPYCFDAALFARPDAPEPVRAGEPVRFLFVGQVAARKGIRHALEAIARLPESGARLTVVGPVALPEELLAPFRDRVEFVGAVPRSEVPAIMRRHDALVFPSYNEGSATVLLEAMASGLAVIQTRASGLGASAASGFVHDRPDTDAVEEAMRALIDDRDMLHAMRLSAMEEARERDFAAYRGNIARLLEKMGI